MAPSPKPHSVFIRLVLPPYTVHFKSASYIKDATLEMLDKKVCKETLKSTAQQPAVRASIGSDPMFWAELCLLLNAAIPSLERRSFTIWDPSSVDYESTSGALIASHYPGLWKDLERLNDLISIGRNVLTVAPSVQDLAASYFLDTEIFRLINCCVRVTARGYDGDAGTGDEERWQWIVNAYKKLLITSLQFLNNLVAQNENRKLMLWVSLFHHSTEPVFASEDVPETSSTSLTDVPSNPYTRPIPPMTQQDFLIAFGTDGDVDVDTSGAEPLWDHLPFENEPLPKDVLDAREKLKEKAAFHGNGYSMYVKRATSICKEDYNLERKRDPTLGEMFLEMPRRWADLGDEDRRYWQNVFDDSLAKYRQEFAVYEAKLLAVQLMSMNLAAVAEQPNQTQRKVGMLEEQLAERYKTEGAYVTPLEPAVYGRDGHLTFSQSVRARAGVSDNMKMLFTAEAGTKILESGKAELMKRLEGYEPSSIRDPGIQPAPSRTSELLPAPSHGHKDAKAIALDPGSQVPKSKNTGPAPKSVELPTYDNNNNDDDDHDNAHDVNDNAALDGRHSLTQDPTEEAFDESADEEEEEEDESGEEAEEEEEEDYPGSTEDGRGLLTDVPLILGPSEIEVLPMLIMSGIVPPPSLPPGMTLEQRNALMNMHTVRTHLLLSQSNGRNLLRELLIFVAAWDLREEELYFKFMVKIVESILKNGLMPYAYHAFRDRSRSKDIISPAQAVIMKLLTCIFRARQEAFKAAVAASSRNLAMASQSTAGNRPVYEIPSKFPSRVDLHILNFIFTEFRQHIIPQTGALIFLQGQIHAGRASPEDFPLNLWDMERMYEGVYQYLEFFAVLTEESFWKEVLGEWEMASELVTLLRELESGIPKMGGTLQQMPRKVSHQHQTAPAPVPQRTLSVDAGTQHYLTPPASEQTAASVAVERPFDVSAPNAENKLSSLPAHSPAPTPAPQQAVYEAETPLAYPAPDELQHSQQPLSHDQDEPSDFEWRNLKKLTVLVLSSLIWKNSTVQDQVRRFGGLEALVGCCRPDEHNPYIREHAIMCLRFAVEGSEENGKVIRDMADVQNRERKGLKGGSVTLTADQDVPREVLDTQGYETFMDGKGQVGLRRKEPQHQQAMAASSSGGVAGGAGVQKQAPPRLSGTKLTAERAAELMSSALSSLPLGDKVFDRGKLEALAKLDRGFDATGSGRGGNKG